VNLFQNPGQRPRNEPSEIGKHARTIRSVPRGCGRGGGGGGGGYDAAAAGLEWWRNAAEQSTVVTRAKKASATASDIPATARSSASCAPRNNTASAIVLGSPPVAAPLEHAVVSSAGPLAQACAYFIATREEGEGPWGGVEWDEKRRVTRGAATGGSGGGDTTTWTGPAPDETQWHARVGVACDLRAVTTQLAARGRGESRVA